MIKDAVYASLLKRARATLHERFVTWAERVNRERGREQEFEEIHGYHLEQAYRYRTELGPARRRGSRDRRARRDQARPTPAGAPPSRGDMPASVSLLKRAAAVLPTESPARLGILFDLGEAMIGARCVRRRHGSSSPTASGSPSGSATSAWSRGWRSTS